MAYEPLISFKRLYYGAKFCIHIIKPFYALNIGIGYKVS